MDQNEIVGVIVRLNGDDRRVVWLHNRKTRVVMINTQWYQVYNHRPELPVCYDCKGPDAIGMAVMAVKKLEWGVAVA